MFGNASSMSVSPILLFHIVVGTIALLAGAAAYIYRKGSVKHRVSGKTFAISMFLMTLTGAILGLVRPATLSTLMGLFTFYLVATSWLIVRRRPNQTGRLEWVLLCAVLLVSAGLLYFGNQAANSPTGFIEEVPIGAKAYYFFAGLAVFAALGDIHLLYKNGLAAGQRIARHLWRMGAAMYIATTSIFLGNPQVFPESLRGGALLQTPGNLVLLLTVFWLSRTVYLAWQKTTKKRLLRTS